jgi:putative ABC transport system substrate-binding protein
MRRRDVVVLIGGAAAFRPLASLAQQKPMPVIGWLNSIWPPADLGDWSRGPIHEGLSQTGYLEGQNLAAEYRWAEDQYDRLPALAADLVSRKVDLIISVGGTPTALAAKGATSAIPIVFTEVSDPVGVGLVASLARPGGNVTGVADLTAALVPKHLELLSELVPQAKVIALLVNPNNPIVEPLIRDIQEVARRKGVELPIVKASSEDEIEAAFEMLPQLRASALLIAGDQLFGSRQEKVAALASQHAIPTAYLARPFVEAGGLVSYGIDYIATKRQAGIYAGRILKGEKPADLPVQQPTKFELFINLKTAKALGLTVSPALLARADEVIE